MGDLVVGKRTALDQYDAISCTRLQWNRISMRTGLRSAPRVAVLPVAARPVTVPGRH
jgi:hypothetical protein